MHLSNSLYLSKLLINVYSREFRRDHADIRQMHRTVMSGYPDLPDDSPARQSYGVLWRLDLRSRGFVQYVQSVGKPDWSRLPGDYLSDLRRSAACNRFLTSSIPDGGLPFG